MFLDVHSLPRHIYSHYRTFVPGEKHITRHCGEDVLLLMFSGLLRFSEDGTPIEVKAGEYYIQRKGLYQQGIVASDSPHYYYIHFDGQWSIESGIPVRGTLPAEAAHLVKKLDDLCEMNASILARSALFYQLLSALPLSEPDTPQKRLAEAIRTELNNALTDGISLSELSAKLHFSPNYLIRVFREVYHQTPYEHLIHLRLEKAEMLARYSDLSMKAIAAECGFGQYVNLYKTFRKVRGISPGDLRK